MQKDKTLGVIVPTYGHFEYAARAIRSALGHTRTKTHVIVVDDGSVGGLDALKNLYHQLETGRSRLTLFGFDNNGGLTRSWNQGLRIARNLGCAYTCCGNSDLVFPVGWDVPIVTALENRDVHLVGPVTNAPGTESKQDVKRYVHKYELTDEQAKLDKLCMQLTNDYGSEIIEATINGFCMVAKTETWWKNAFDKENVFRPRNDYDSQGRPNPTPLMTLNEYELQRRWHKAGLKSAICPGSFVFHYRAVSRGDRYKKGNWYRMGT